MSAKDNRSALTRYLDMFGAIPFLVALLLPRMGWKSFKRDVLAGLPSERVLPPELVGFLHAARNELRDGWVGARDLVFRHLLTAGGRVAKSSLDYPVPPFACLEDYFKHLILEKRKWVRPSDHSHPLSFEEKTTFPVLINGRLPAEVIFYYHDGWAQYQLGVMLSFTQVCQSLREALELDLRNARYREYSKWWSPDRQDVVYLWYLIDIEDRERRRLTWLNYIMDQQGNLRDNTKNWGTDWEGPFFQQVVKLLAEPGKFEEKGVHLTPVDVETAAE